MLVSSDSIPTLHVLVSEAVLDDALALETARGLVELGPDVAVHLRARVPAARLFDVARDLAARARVSGGWCVVNGRPDVALAASAQAVQLGRNALPISDVRRVLGSSKQVHVGVSVHGVRHAEVAVAEGASYLVAGTAYATPSHPGRAGVGPSGIADVAASAADAGVPVLAIGGVRVDRVGELAAAGAAGVVVGSAVWDSADPLAAASKLVRELESAFGG